MEQNKGSASKLLQYSILETKDELDEKLSRCYTALCGMIGSCSDREANDVMNTHVAKGNSQYEDVQLGLLATILIEPKSAARGYRDMNLINRDGLNIVLSRVNQLIFEKWLKLLDSCRTQILWFCKELVKTSVTGTESIVSNLLRQISGGDVSHKNIWLTENILDMLAENRGWLEKFPALLSTTIYTYLRVIVDHGSPSVAVLRQKEVDFCSLLLREKFSDCMLIGRDLVRLMQYVARIPEFEKIWRDMLLNPSALCAQFTGVAQLLQIRTSRKYFISRLTPDMENKLVFLTTKVKFGQHKRYQEWFQRQYLATAESQSLRCDLIRYICAVFHPSNELLCSEIIPRWAVIGWMLTTCTSNVAASNAKLSLFYDWLYFDPERDSIMNIEPAILVMYHSMRPHPAITATLLDFMCRIMPNFCPALSPQIRQGIFTSLRSILDKRVLPSLSPLFDNSKLDKELRGLIKETFTEFCSAEVVKEDPLLNSKDLMMDIDNGNHIDNNSLSEGVFSDEEEEVPLGKLKPHDMTFKPIKEHQKYEPVEITDSIAQLPDQLKTFVLQLQNEVDQEVQCDLMDRLMQAVIQEDDLDQDIATPLATCLCEVLISQFNNNLFPQELDIDMIEDSIGTPLFVMFRNLCQTPEEDPSRQPLLLLIGEMYLKQPRIGYHLLYFLKVSKVHDDRMSTYKDFCKSLDSRDVESCLMSDLKLCQEDDVRLFTYLMPEMYTKFPNIAIGNAELLNMIVSCIDGTQLQDLVCQILQGHLIMFRKDSFLSVLNASLEWETLEQYFLWQLISAHNIPVEHIMPILPKLEFTSHSEALTCVMVLLKQESPSGDLIRPLLCRECKKNDMFTVSVLKYWAQEYEDRLAELIYAQLNKINGTPKKRQRSISSSSRSKDSSPSIDQILAHLDHMRQVCRNVSFLNHESVQHTLQTVQMIASEVQKTKYSDLLALAEDFDDFKTVRVLRGRKTSSAMISPKSARSKKQIEDSDSYSDSTEEEDLKPKAKKRKKVTLTIDDDSD